MFASACVFHGRGPVRQNIALIRESQAAEFLHLGQHQAHKTADVISAKVDAASDAMKASADNAKHGLFHAFDKVKDQGADLADAASEKV
jgi:hypothetical protein